MRPPPRPQSIDLDRQPVVSDLDPFGQVAARHNLSRADAHALIERVDGERAAFYRAHFNADVSEPDHFDLLLNVSKTSLETCVQIVVAAFEARFASASAPPKSQVRATAPVERAPASARAR